MCDHEELYEYFPAITIGGPAGDYSIPTPTSSNRWAEFAVVAVVIGASGAGAMVVSGNSKPVAVAYDGTLKADNDNHIKGILYRLTTNFTLFPNAATYERITNSEKKVYVRIDPPGGSAMFVTIRFRNRILTRIPGPNTTVHPNNMQDLNNARADATRQRLGLDKDIEEGESLNAIRR